MKAPKMTRFLKLKTFLQSTAGVSKIEWAMFALVVGMTLFLALILGGGFEEVFGIPGQLFGDRN